MIHYNNNTKVLKLMAVFSEYQYYTIHTGLLSLRHVISVTGYGVPLTPHSNVAVWPSSTVVSLGRRMIMGGTEIH